MKKCYKLGKIVDLRSEKETEDHPDILADVEDIGASIGDFVEISFAEKVQ